MKKGTFYKKIRAKKEAKGFKFVKAEGYIEAIKGWIIAYHKSESGRYWCATDTETGNLVCDIQNTRKEARAAAEEALEKLNEKNFKESEDYKRFIKDMADFFEKKEPKEEAQEGENEMKQTKKRARTIGKGICEKSEVVEWKDIVKVKKRASIKKLEKKEKPANWTRNEELHGIEITFKEKPEKAVRDMLKSVGFRWHNAKGLWYAKETEARVKVAEMVCA